MVLCRAGRSFYPRHPRGWRRQSDGESSKGVMFLSTPPSRVATHTLARCKGLTVETWEPYSPTAWACVILVYDAAELAEWRERGDLPVRKLFNTSGVLYRERNIKAQLDAGMSGEDALALLAENGMLVKRPLVVGDDFVLVGFREQVWQERLG